LGWYDNEELTGTPVDSVGPDETGDKDFYAKWFDLKRPPIDPADSCYEISDVAELYGFSALVNGKFAKDEKTPGLHLWQAYAGYCCKQECLEEKRNTRQRENAGILLVEYYKLL
jgi:hypothetical protein